MTVEDSRSGLDAVLLKIIPAADFYVVRVARRGGDLVSSTDNVANVCFTSVLPFITKP
jgi:hypothetical protein